MDLHKKTAVITGTSKGIGRSIALKMAEKGANIIMNYKSDDASASITLNEIKKITHNVEMIKGDVSDYAFAGYLINSAVKKFGKIDILVNNAGISKFGLFTDMDIDDWNNIINNNLKSVFNCTHHAVKQMLKYKSGSIINISSVWGNVGSSCEVLYSTSKGGINAFTKALAKELAPSGIRVNAIAPGIINTQMNSRLSTEELEMLKNQIPAGRLGTPEEVAELAVFLVSDSASYITAQVICVDGGWI
ncbi:MAG: SDR family oxidoreductase [Desulfotomaculum sp.]|nr:SDR family oxidoreductase [Desulfotomaculum sp.]MCL0106558.1 SDR family oxidoreductase [Peptococcaceae bacterium]